MYKSILLILLVLSGDAFSASSWILWAEIYTVWEPNEVTKKWGKHNTNWKLLNAFDDKKACDNNIKNEINKITAPDDNKTSDVAYKIEEDIVTLFYFPYKAKKSSAIQSFETYRYICIPDTIDPRK